MSLKELVDVCEEVNNEFCQELVDIGTRMFKRMAETLREKGLDNNTVYDLIHDRIIRQAEADFLSGFVWPHDDKVKNAKG